MRNTFLSISALAAMVSTSVSALPASASAPAWKPVQVIDPTIATADTAALPPTSSSLAAGLKSFLDHYQPDSYTASDQAAAVQLTDFPAAGLCTQEYPCFSVGRVGLASFGPDFTMTTTQMSDLLDAILAKGEVTYDQSNPATVISGLQVKANGLTLDVIAPPGTQEASVLAGSVFDLFKAQGLDGANNGVRGIAAHSPLGGQPAVGMCVYPTNADAVAAKNFCHGKELDGTRPSAPSGRPGRVMRRFSLGGLLAGFCSLIDVPLLCPSEE